MRDGTPFSPVSATSRSWVAIGAATRNPPCTTGFSLKVICRAPLWVGCSDTATAAMATRVPTAPFTSHSCWSGPDTKRASAQSLGRARVAVVAPVSSDSSSAVPPRATKRSVVFGVRCSAAMLHCTSSRPPPSFTGRLSSHTSEPSFLRHLDAISLPERVSEMVASADASQNEPTTTRVSSVLRHTARPVLVDTRARTAGTAGAVKEPFEIVSTPEPERKGCISLTTPTVSLVQLICPSSSSYSAHAACTQRSSTAAARKAFALAMRAQLPDQDRCRVRLTPRNQTLQHGPTDAV
mmetsp:Transcript_15522/g.39636  ORF Transcript_15522/g.39636 Transcript_15522/m.39636 type:complete len:295 (+) Transcript_15522:1663-2547(+)